MITNKINNGVDKNMLNEIMQTTPPDTFMDLLDPANLPTTVAVVVLWAIAGMYGWWALSGKGAIPKRLMAITFIAIAVGALMLTFYINPDFYDLAQTNIAEFAVVVLGSAAFGIVLLPMVAMMALGALAGRMGGS